MATITNQLPALTLPPHVKYGVVGPVVNLASRIAEFARPGEVLVTPEVVDGSELAGVEFREIGPVELKGIGGAVNLHAAQRSAS